MYAAHGTVPGLICRIQEESVLPIINIFSKRQKKLRGETPDVYTYDDLPDPLRVQIVHIWTDTLVTYQHGHIRKAEEAYKFIVESLCNEYGVFQLARTASGTVYRDGRYVDELQSFFLQEKDVEKALDAVELSFRVIAIGNPPLTGRNYAFKRADDAIKELNHRFKEHGVGYQFANGQIIRIDSEFIHAEIVKPALKLLGQKHYAGAQQEFFKAHEHYRKGDAKAALAECLKAFESIMKAICEKRGWSCSSNAPAKHLIQACFENGLIPSFWQSHYSSLRSLLESSVPTGRNKLGAHGQGTIPVSVPSHLVAYMLHMTASAIVFLAEAEKNLS